MQLDSTNTKKNTKVLGSDDNTHQWLYLILSRFNLYNIGISCRPSDVGFTNKYSKACPNNSSVEHAAPRTGPPNGRTDGWMDGWMDTVTGPRHHSGGSSTLLSHLSFHTLALRNNNC